MLWFFISVFLVFLFLILSGIVQKALNLEKSWVFELVFDIVFDIVLGMPIFALVYSLTESIVLPLVIVFIFIFLLRIRLLYSDFVQRKPRKSKLYRLPFIKCEGTIAEKHIHTHPKTLYRREWIVFITVNRQQITAYISAPDFGPARESLSTLNVGDVGTLHYRKGRNFDYFEEFDPE